MTNPNNSQLQAFLRFIPGGGWTAGSIPIIGHRLDEEKWAIPLNMVVNQTVILGKMPVKSEVGLNITWNNLTPFGPESMVGFNITPVVPNILNRWVHR